MPSKRSDMTATTVADGIYLVGGCANDQEWSADADMRLAMACHCLPLSEAPVARGIFALVSPRLLRSS